MHEAINHAVPLTVEGSSVLHQMLRIRWAAWRALDWQHQGAILSEAASVLAEMETREGGQSALFSMLGHKGDLMMVHFRKSFDELNAAELKLASLRLWDYLEPTTSYLSVIELGLYESSVKEYSGLLEKGIAYGSEEWQAAVEEVLNRQRAAMAPRLWPTIPPNRYLCFYPMDRRRGEQVNWYRVPIRDRQRMMQEHGTIGRRYAGTVKQIITGSIGFDDWEWGVDLFADDPLVFKKLIYEMRFDEVSAAYALFGPFYIGLRFPSSKLAELFAGTSPEK